MSNDTELEIVSVLEDARLTAMTEQDADTLERLFSDDLFYMHSGGSLDSKRSFIDTVRNGPLRYVSIERRNTDARLAADDTAFFTGEASIRVEVDGQPIDLELRYVAVWVRHDGSWRFEAWHSARL